MLFDGRIVADGPVCMETAWPTVVGKGLSSEFQALYQVRTGQDFVVVHDRAGLGEPGRDIEKRMRRVWQVHDDAVGLR